MTFLNINSRLLVSNPIIQNIIQNKNKYVESNKYRIHREIIVALLATVYPLIIFTVFAITLNIFPEEKLSNMSYHYVFLIACIMSVIVVIFQFDIYKPFVTHFVNNIIPLQYRPFTYRSSVEIEHVIMPANISRDLFIIVGEYQNNEWRERIFALTWMIRTVYISSSIAFNKIGILTVFAWFFCEVMIITNKRNEGFSRPCMLRYCTRCYLSQEEEYNDAYHKHRQLNV